MEKRTFSIGNFKTEVVFIEQGSCLDSVTGTSSYVFDTNTRPLFNLPPEIDAVVLPAGEVYKNWHSIDTICSSALDAGLSRDGTFIGVGGGVVCDLTGLAASLFMRGAGLVFVPTTLLAMTDAALGGKTGFDYEGYKNILGTFYPAQEIRICPSVLAQLPEKEFKSGLAEVIKHAFLRDRELLALLVNRKADIMARDPEILAEVIDKSLGVKGWYVEQDFLEKGIRAHLNFGHTFGHALESAMGLGNITHGEAVMWGIKTALETGLILGKTDKSWVEEADEIIRLYGYKTDYQKYFTVEKLIEAMAFDKKKKNDQVRYVLQHSHADTFITPLAADVLKQVLSLSY